MNRMYIENPKTEGSGIFACIPQTEVCPINCDDCFFQSGRSYLEPLKKNLPNMPDPDDVYDSFGIVRVNDGNDSNIDRDAVMSETLQYDNKFYNTSIPNNLESFRYPVVLTLNPGKITDINFHKLKIIPKNLMFVRFRTNTWNIHIMNQAINHYIQKNVPVVLTFMAYFKTLIPDEYKQDYICRIRTLNDYYAITTYAWEKIMTLHRYNKLVYSCGRIEGELGDTKCKYCGNCIREFHNTMIRIKNTI